MEIIVSANSARQRQLPPEGSHAARCIEIISMGTIQTEFQDGVKALKKVRIGWELPEEKVVFDEEKGEQPFKISKSYTLSLSEKSNLRRALVAWRGKDFTPEELEGFNILKLLGAPCMITIIHKVSKAKGTQYADISSITSLPKQMQCPPQINKSFAFSVDDWDAAAFATLPEWLQNEIKTSEEYISMATQESEARHYVEDGESPNDSGQAEDDDLPF